MKISKDSFLNSGAVKLHFDKGTTFRLVFGDGSTRSYDILTLAKKFPQLNALKNRKLFLKGHLLGWGAVVWNDELDIDSEEVYEYGKLVETEVSDFPAIIGFRLKHARNKVGLSQEELATKIHIDQGDLSRIEKGTANPSLKTIARIMKALNVPFDIRKWTKK